MTVATRPPATANAQAPGAPESGLMAEGHLCACLQARMTARALTRMYDEALRPTGLKVTQLSLLAAIAQGVPGSISALADRLALERTTLTRNLKLLGDAGLIAPRPGAGRAVAHELTDAGREALARAAPLWRKAQDAVEAAMGEAGWREAGLSLRALRRAARDQTGAPGAAATNADATSNRPTSR